jgi:hypothetical protein
MAVIETYFYQFSQPVLLNTNEYCFYGLVSNGRLYFSKGILD